MAEKVTFTSVLASRGFRFLWSNQILVQLAYNTLNFALLIWVFKLIGNNLAVSAFVLSMYLPVVLFGIFAGVFVDIYDRRKIIVIIDILLAASFFIFIFIKQSYPLILLNSFLLNSLVQFFMPSEGSAIPLLVSKKLLFTANSLFSLTLYGSLMVGYSIAGPILNIFGINMVFVLGTIMMIFAFLMAQQLPSMKTLGKKTKLNLLDIRQILKVTFKEAKETLRFIKGKLSITASIAMMSAAQGAIGITAVIMPSYLERVLHIHATDASYFMMLPLGLGLIIGATLLGRLFGKLPRRTLVIPAIMGAGLVFIIIGLLPTLAHIFQSNEIPSYITRPRYFFRAPSLAFFFSIVAFILGLCSVAIIIPCQTIIQENTTEKNRGKILAVLYVLMNAFAAIPVIIAGVLSDLFGVTTIFIVLGIIVLIIGVVVFRPHLFFDEDHLPFKIREFLGTGHWEKDS